MKKWIALILMGFSCAACSSSPDPDYFLLSPVTGPVAPDLKDSLKVQRPLLANYLDRPDFVRQDSLYHLEIDESRAWAEPLDSMIERVLADDLRQRLPSSIITTETGNMSAGPQTTVSSDIQYFNLVESGHASLQAQVVLHGLSMHEQTVSLPVRLEVPASSSGAGQAAALSGLVGQLADHIVESLKGQELVKTTEEQ